VKSHSVLVFGSSGFVGKSLVKNSTRKLICPVRVNGEWVIDLENLETNDKKVDVIIAVGPARFSSSNSKDHDRDIVSKIYEFLNSREFQVEKVVYISSLAALESNPKNSYGISKANAEEFIKTAFENVTIFRPPALFGQGMSNESHLNWFLNRRKLFYLFSKFTNSGISLLHVDDFAKIVHKEIENSSPTNSVIYPNSTAIHFRDLALLLNRKKVNTFREVRIPNFNTIVSKFPFKLQPLFRPIWIDKSHCEVNDHENQIDKIQNHILRFLGIPTETAPVIVIGGNGGLGRAICETLNNKRIHFISVDLDVEESAKAWNYCQNYWQVDLTNDVEIELFYQKLNCMQDVSWIVTAAGRGLRGDVRDTSRDERLNFWKLMLLSRIDLLAWAQDRSHQQEHIGLINVSSSSGYFPLPKYGDYSASNNSLRLIGRVGNLGFPKLTLKTIVPGGMKTTLMKDYGDLKKFHAGAMDPEYVARKLVDMMKPHSRKEVPVGLNSRVLKILSTPIFNGAFQFVMNNISKRVR
jgi:short-subunit dehydrogenase